MSPWKQKPLETLSLPSGREVLVEARGVAARHRDLWILLHGLGGSRKSPLLRAFLRRLREAAAVVIAPDLPGHGGSSGGIQDLSVESGIETVEAIYSRWGTLSGRVFLLGFSTGGLVAAWWAALNPGKAAGLVLAAPALRLPERLRQGAKAGDLEKAEETGLLEGLLGESPFKAGYRLATDDERYPPERLAQKLRDRTLILHGREDKALPWEDSLEFFRAANGPVELCLLPGATHGFTGMEQAAFLRVRAFWKSLE